jgi:lipopolysaccharide biosynthesis glycosyltransferase
VIDLTRWKQEQVSERVLVYLRDYPDHARYWDQSALNATLYGRWLRLQDTWNTPAFWADKKKDSTSLEDPILHFVGPDKAWLLGHHRKPAALRFFDELDHTAWRGWRPNLLRNVLKRIKYRVHSLIH